MATASEENHPEIFDVEEALRRFYPDKNDVEGMPSGIQSDLDLLLYELNPKLGKRSVNLQTSCFSIAPH